MEIPLFQRVGEGAHRDWPGNKAKYFYPIVQPGPILVWDEYDPIFKLLDNANNEAKGGIVITGQLASANLTADFALYISKKLGKSVSLLYFLFRRLSSSVLNRFSTYLLIRNATLARRFAARHMAHLSSVRRESVRKPFMCLVPN
jgi:hypothetical protein